MFSVYSFKGTHHCKMPDCEILYTKEQMKILLVLTAHYKSLKFLFLRIFHLRIFQKKQRNSCPSFPITKGVAQNLMFIPGCCCQLFGQKNEKALTHYEKNVLTSPFPCYNHILLFSYFRVSKLQALGHIQSKYSFCK